MSEIISALHSALKPGPHGGPRMRIKCIYARPYCGAVWDSAADLFGLSHRPLPTKTSRTLIQLTGRSWYFCRAFFHVFLMRFVFVLFLSIFVAVIRSHVSRSLTFLSHLALWVVMGAMSGLVSVELVFVRFSLSELLIYSFTIQPLQFGRPDN